MQDPSVPDRSNRLANLSLPGVLDGIPDAFVILDSEWRILYINPEAARIHGKPAEGSIGKTYFDEWPEARASEIERQYQRAAAEACSVHFEHRYIAAGHDVWLEIHAYPLDDLLVVTYRDITARKQAEAEAARLKSELQARIDDLRTLFQTAPVALAIAEDAECKTIRVNPAFATLLGVPEDENTSKSGAFADRLPFRFMREGREIPADELPQQSAHRTGCASGVQEIEIVRDGGERVYVYGSAAPLFDCEQRVRGSVAAFVDVTARREQEEASRLLSERLRFHVENTPLAAIEFDADYRITNWSAQAERMFGWSADEVMGKRISDLRWVYEEDAEDVAELSRAMSGGVRLRNVHRNRNYHKSGSLMWCEWYNSALVDRHGKLISVFSLVLDVTKRTRAERELRQSKEDLEQFVDVLAHDLQEPLRTIRLYGELLSRGGAGSVDENVLGHLATILEGAKRMSDLIAGLLEWARAARGTDAGAQVVAADQALQLALLNLRMLIDENHAAISAGALPLLKAETSQLALVFQNLIGNAIKYRKDSESPRIGIAAERRGNEWLISVSDNGCGFPQQYADRVFLPFHRLHERTRSGSGLGLAIVQRIVQRFGGRVWAESCPGAGSKFSFTWPAAD